MPSPTPLRSFLPQGLAATVSLLKPRSVLLLKSFQPEMVRGERAVHLSGNSLSPQVGTVRSGSPRVLCLGPGEWWVVGRGLSSNLDALRPPDADALGFTVCDLSRGLCAFHVSGAGSRALLAKGCGLDLHPEGLGSRGCARTRFAQIPVVIDCIHPPDHFELYAPRSYSDYIGEWLGLPR
jgi:sarcosine oxidase subunit gamma